MGEIGVPRREFLFDIQFWEVRRIIRGYRSKQDSLFVVMRHLAYMIMQTGMADLRKSGFNSPADILPLQSDKPDHDTQLSDDEVEEIRRKLQKENARRKQAMN